MILRRLKASGLAHNTYYLSSQGEAVIIDPRRVTGDVEEILALARDDCSEIKYILETHRNEDFVHGSKEIATRTDAAIRHGSKLPFKYGDPMGEGDEVSFGRMKLRALETPGHTPETLSYALYDGLNPDVALAVFTGDVLFVGSTGRVDLAPGSKAENARLLYESIHDKLLPLGDQTMLCPAHGAGSVCGAGMGDRDWSTLGYEKLTNPHLQLSKAEFVEAKVNEKFIQPPYFRTMEDYNLNGPPSLAGRKSLHRLELKEFKNAMDKDGTVLVDTRLPQAFGGGHIPGSYSIWLDGMALFPGWLFKPHTEIVLLPYRNEDAYTADRYLCRIGYDNVTGFLCGGFEKWQNAGLPIEYTGEVSADKLKAMIDSGEVLLLDVREPREWQEGTVPGAKMLYVGDLEQKLDEVPRDKPVASMCSVGHRGSTGASILKRAGFKDVYNVLGGFTAWKQKKYPVAKTEVKSP
ncbi:rhodanese-like domain-containing protein [Methanocella sp. MCL-LM]|uniref:rhodanese-like domain-containing protein n=1 Tax=Methanocella sp. MCL-LM TaxID=3412035 RepID=UPI003C70AE8B